MRDDRSLRGTVTTEEGVSWLIGVAITLVGFVGLRLLIRSTSPEMAAEPWLIVWLELAVLIVVALLLLIWLLRWRETMKFAAAIGVVGLFLSFIVMASLRNTPFNLEALSGDQGFYSAYVTKFAHYRSYVDVVYADLPAFYPPLFYYLLGRIAAFLAIEPFQMLKLSVLATTLALPFVLTLVWRRLVTLPLATVAAFTLLVEQQWYKPAEWITMTIFLPWWLYWVENVTQQRFPSRRRQWLWWLTGGLIGGLLFQGYYYWFFIGGISLLLQLGLALTQQKPLAVIKAYLASALPVLIGSALFSMPFWAPYLYSMVSTGGRQVLQNRWLASYNWLSLPLPVAGGALGSVALFGGILYLGATAGANRISRSLLIFLVAIYGWIGLGYVGILADTPLLHFRAYPMVNYVVALGLGFGLVQLWRLGLSALSLPGDATVVSLTSRRAAATLLVILIAIYAQSTVQEWLKNENDRLEAATTTYPATQLAALDAAVQNDYINKTILLSLDYVDWVSYRPFFSFLAWSAHYSHPAAHFFDRLDLLESLTTVHSPTLFAALLMNNRYAHIDHLALGRTEDQWTFVFFNDDFPQRNLKSTLTFAAANLTEPYFQATAAGSQTILTPTYGANPLPALAGFDPTTAPLEEVALAYTLAARYGQHLTIADFLPLQEDAYARLVASDLSTLSLTTLLDLAPVPDASLRSQVDAALATVLAHPVQELLTDQNGVQKLRLIGYTIETATAEQPPRIVLYLEVLDVLDWDYTIWFHALQGETKQNLDFTPIQATSTWRPGNIVNVERSLPLGPGDYELVFGFWRSEEDVRLVLPSGDVGLSLGSVTVP
ncbi:MAG: arabinofuranosyltransferase [Caldilineaceae bacterium]